MRSRAIACLDRAGIAWRVVFVSHSLSGIWAAVQAGLGIIAHACRDARNLRVAGGILPSPGNLGIMLAHGHGNVADTGARAKLGQLMEAALLNVK
jgi:DNA-binding transcriptional LysR family regulator